MPKLLIRRRRNKYQAHTDRPTTVTGNFELQFEEVIRNNRLVIIAFVATGLIALAAFIPAAVYQSLAGSERVSVEVESGIISNPSQVIKVQNDNSAAGGGYIEFGPAK